ncbi:uncharacterized protein At4g13200, chloroplastic [Amaranthus tricolor]|uniref:uncharacterized protein At4g13200, chloroplastic n=1 Tax=Amaranthus tricolor TaxID=29722 RepID=UPI002587B4C5|nr:uncharacterized protein At4g13200, chloroplastic [Amaranthus tricolor]
MINSGVSSSVSPQSSFNSLILNRTVSSNTQFPSLLFANYPQTHLPNSPSPYLSLSSRSQSSRPIFCRASSGSGENDNKTVLDAFFLGKALGETLTERLESAVGEFLSTIGRLQAEQQKQVQEFQDDVLERAKRAKEKAAREALEEQGKLISNTTTKNTVERNVSNLSAPTSVAKPDSPRRVEDEDQIDSDSQPSISVTIDE